MAKPGTPFEFRAGGHAITVDVAHACFATAIAGWCAWFGYDAWQAQADVENLILIVPVALAALAFYAVVLAGCVRIGNAAEVSASPRAPLAKGMGLKIAVTMALLVAYVVLGPLVGFDVTSFAYILAMLLLHGERRPLVLLLVPTLFCIVAVYLFGSVLGTPLPLLLLPGDGG
jgi:hypothetical protein